MLSSYPSAGRRNWLRTELSAWNDAIDGFLAANRPGEALPLIRVVLKSLPRHLPTYFRLLQAIWLLRRWGEGRDWARRLLRADPCNELAWAVLANAEEVNGALAEARTYWLRALENAPYNRPIRKGITRTSIGQNGAIALNRPALATLYRLGGRWNRAILLYLELLREQPRRLDFQCDLLESLWRTGRNEDALRLARHLVQRQPDLFLGWLVSARVGDEDDQALAQAPLAALDPDGEYTAVRYGVRAPGSVRAHIVVAPDDAELLD